MKQMSFRVNHLHRKGTRSLEVEGLIANNAGGGSALPLPTITSYLQQMLAATLHLKKMGLAHRDVKADNIMLTGPLDRGGARKPLQACVHPKVSLNNSSSCVVRRFRSSPATHPQAEGNAGSFLTSDVRRCVTNCRRLPK